MKHYILILLIATLSFGNTNYIAGPPSGYLGQVFKNKSGFYVGFKFGYQYTLDGAWQINPTTTPQEMLYKNDTLWASLDSENPAIHFSTDDGLNYKLLRDDIPGSISDFLYSPPGLLCMEVYHNDNSHNYCINESQQIDSISFEDFLAMGVHPAAAGRIFNNWDAYPSTQMGTLKLDIEDDWTRERDILIWNYEGYLDSADLPDSDAESDFACNSSTCIFLDQSTFEVTAMISTDTMKTWAPFVIPNGRDARIDNWGDEVALYTDTKTYILTSTNKWQKLPSGIPIGFLRTAAPTSKGLLYAPYSTPLTAYSLISPLVLGYKAEWNLYDQLTDDLTTTINGSKAIASVDDTVFLATNDEGFFYSTDLGYTWNKRSEFPRDFVSYEIRNPNGMGVWNDAIHVGAISDPAISYDYGETWTQLNNAPSERPNRSYGEFFCGVEGGYDEFDQDFYRGYCSLDSGQTWTQVVTPHDSTVEMHINSNELGAFIVQGGDLFQIQSNFSVQKITTPHTLAAIFATPTTLFFHKTGGSKPLASSDIVYTKDLINFPMIENPIGWMFHVQEVDFEGQPSVFLTGYPGHTMILNADDLTQNLTPTSLQEKQRHQVDKEGYYRIYNHQGQALGKVYLEKGQEIPVMLRHLIFEAVK